MTDKYDFTQFWPILSGFPQIKSLDDLSRLIVDIEHSETYTAYPEGYGMLKEFESAMRSHLYTEWHAQENLDGIEAA
jgi:hypothetical protein